MRTKRAEPGHHKRSNLARVRANGMRSASRATGLTAAASLLLTIVFSAVAAIGFSGHPKASGGGSAAQPASGGASTNSVRVALPPKGGGGTLQAPVTQPVTQNAPAPPPVTSGGS